MPNYPTGRIFAAYRRKVVSNEELDGIFIRRVWLSPSNTASALARGWSMASFVLSLKLFAFRFVRKMEPALVVVSSPPLPMATAVVRYFSKRHFKVLLNVSDIWPLSAKALGVMDRSKLYTVLELAATRMYRSADAITAQSSETLEHIRELGTPGQPAMLYRNLPAVPKAGIRQAVTEHSDKVIIVYPGLLGHAQGLPELCRAVDFRAAGTELHIYGDGPDAAEIRAYVRANPGWNIKLHRPVSADELASVLRSASAMLIPLAALIEGALPSKLFTAAHAGVPVLYSGGGEGAALVARHHLGWIATPGDYETISAQIRELCELPAAQLAQWRTEIAAEAATHLNKEQQDAQFLQFIAQIIGPVSM